MTQWFDEEGRRVAVTVIEAGPCIVTRVREDEDGRRRHVQVGYERVDGKRLSKPRRGYFEKNGLPPMKVLREFSVDESDRAFEKGEPITVEIFDEGEYVDVIGTTKGRGFQGVVKRWGFAGYKDTHGTKDKHRVPGSIGASTFPARVWKNKKLPGRYGHCRKTTKNLKIVKIIPEENLILLRGAVPGSRGNLVTIRATKPRGE